MAEELFNSSTWDAKNFYTANELAEFISSIREDFIGKTIDKIMVMGHIYTSVGYDDNENRCVTYSGNNEQWYIDSESGDVLSTPTHKVALSLDEPLVLCFENKYFEIEYCEFSNAKIGINTLTFEEKSHIEGCENWKDVSIYFIKNIIGQKLVDIKINFTTRPNEYVSHYRKIGESMYDEIIFIFENGQQLEIASDIDYMSLSEKSIWQKQQDLAKRDWDYYYDSKEFLDDDEKTFKELIAESVPTNEDNFIISCNKTWDYNCLDYDFVINNNNTISKCYYGFAVNNMNYLWRFLEAVVVSNNECYLWCEEEGPETFFYVQPENDNKIRFIHISNRRHDIAGLSTEHYKIRQDFIIDKYAFISKFYNCIKTPILNTTAENLEDEMFLYEFEKFEKASEIVRKYLQNARKDNFKNE